MAWKTFKILYNELELMMGLHSLTSNSITSLLSSVLYPYGFDRSIGVAWRQLEESVVYPLELRDLLFSNITTNQCKARFVRNVSHLISTWRLMEKICKFKKKWYAASPIFNNHGLLIDVRPISFPTWSSKGIHTFGDVFDDNGLHFFQDLCKMFNLPGTSYFFYLQLR